MRVAGDRGVRVLRCISSQMLEGACAVGEGYRSYSRPSEKLFGGDQTLMDRVDGQMAVWWCALDFSRPKREDEEWP